MGASSIITFFPESRVFRGKLYRKQVVNLMKTGSMDLEWSVASRRDIYEPPLSPDFSLRERYFSEW